MLSNEFLRNDTDRARQLLSERGVETERYDEWLRLDAERRTTLVELEGLKHQRNEASKAIGEIKKSGGDADAQVAAVGELKVEMAKLEENLSVAEKGLRAIAEALPNIGHETIPVGPDEASNCTEHTFGEPPTFDFEAQAHWDLGPALGILDFESAAKITGARFTTYFGAGARMERALIQFMLDLHTTEHGYTEVIPPYIVNSDSLFGTSQLPKFEEDLYHLAEHHYYLVPTAEVPLTNIHRDEILDESALPIRYTAHTPCFRSEAGSYGKDVRGLIRQHQFNKVELVQFAHPDKSFEALEELTKSAEKVLELLELPYRRICLSSGDMGFSASKTYDLEVWLPGQDAYREISSCSNCTDFQARRANIRFRPEGGGKPRFAHTLNGSGLAVGRTLLAIMENYQNADGTITIPEALRGHMGGLERITARK